MNTNQTIINDAVNIQRHLVEDSHQFNLALECKEMARQARDQAKEVYAEQESNFLFDLTFGDEDYTKAKNAEAREVVKDAKIIKARSSGGLAQAWRALTDAQANLDNAEMALTQADVRYKAVRVAAELQSSMMRLAANFTETLRY
ncbi:MAG: hypothetical protein E6Q97_16110 [Desulfurellales bacterium]|nr:MAG: hypothetical protein E6Q97_16110 [Desulfurellales bacterium]